MEQFSLEKYLENSSRKVVTRDGRPVRIVCWDKLGNYPVIGCIKYSDNYEDFETYSIDGLKYYSGREDSNDLFFVDEEDELSGFEKDLQIIISEASHWTSDDGSISTYCQFGDKEIKKISGQLLDLARKELQPEFDKELDKAYKCADKVQYENGKQDALKNLPKLEKTKDVFDISIPVMYTNAASMKSYVKYNGYKLCINDVFEKLPKEE